MAGQIEIQDDSVKFNGLHAPKSFRRILGRQDLESRILQIRARNAAPITLVVHEEDSLFVAMIRLLRIQIRLRIQ